MYFIIISWVDVSTCKPLRVFPRATRYLNRCHSNVVFQELLLWLRGNSTSRTSTKWWSCWTEGCRLPCRPRSTQVGQAQLHVYFLCWYGKASKSIRKVPWVGDVVYSASSRTSRRRYMVNGDSLSWQIHRKFHILQGSVTTGTGPGAGPWGFCYRAVQNQGQIDPKVVINPPCSPLCGNAQSCLRAWLHVSKTVCTVRPMQKQISLSVISKCALHQTFIVLLRAGFAK